MSDQFTGPRVDDVASGTCRAFRQRMVDGPGDRVDIDAGCRMTAC